MTKDNLRDQVHGRIYRVVWKDGPKSSIKSLAGAKSAELVQALDSGNQFWVLTAQRLIVGNKMTDAAPALKKRVTSGSRGKGAIHALWALQGGCLGQETHQRLCSTGSALRRNAIRALPANEDGRQLFFGSAVIQDRICSHARWPCETRRVSDHRKSDRRPQTRVSRIQRQLLERHHPAWAHSQGVRRR
jgi:hypothetical protein